MAGTPYRPGSALTASPAEIARRNGVTPARSSPRVPGDADGPLSAPKEWHREMDADDGPAVRDLRTPPAIKGAVKVDDFPARSIYPFKEIAADGGIWKLDPAAYSWHGKPIKVGGLRATAGKWAMENGLKAKTVIDGGFLYVQFTRRPA
jgi:hypothetical protein